MFAFHLISGSAEGRVEEARVHGILFRETVREREAND